MFADPEKCTLRRLLGRGKLAVPTYQRGYAWGEDEVKDFIADIDELWRGIRLGPKIHFLGTMLCSPTNHPGFGPQIEVIDGQQRLTTVSILVVAMREAAKQFETSPHASEQLKARAQKLVKTCDELLIVTVDGELYANLSLNEQDAKDWHKLAVEGHRPGPEEYRASNASVQRLFDAFDAISSQLVEPLIALVDPASALESLKQLEYHLDAALDGLLVVLLTAASEKDVYELFMIINDRGKPLSPLDLIRTRTLARLRGDKDRFRSAKLYFAPLVDVEESDASKALVHYINSRAGRRVAKNAMLKEMRKWLDEDDSEANYSSILLERTKRLSAGATYLLELAAQKPDWYGKAWPLEADRVGSERQHRLVAALGHESAKPLLVAGIEKLKAGRFRAMLGVLERIAMRSFICGTVHKSTLADFHIHQAKLMRATHSTWTPESMWLDALSSDLGPGRPTIAIAKDCPDDLFVSRLQELRYTSNRNIIAYLMLGIEGFDFAAGRPSDEIQFHWKEIHLDHVTPQSAEADQVVRDGLVHTIGNLVPLSGRKNSKLKDQAFGPKKAVIYKQSKFLMTREVGLDNERWTSAQVIERTKQLAALAAKVWSLQPALWETPSPQRV